MCEEVGLMFWPIFCVFCLKRGQSGRFVALKISNTDHVLLMVISLLLLLGDSGWFWVIQAGSV